MRTNRRYKHVIAVITVILTLCAAIMMLCTACADSSNGDGGTTTSEPRQTEDIRVVTPSTINGTFPPLPRSTGNN